MKDSEQSVDQWSDVPKPYAYTEAQLMQVSLHLALFRLRMYTAFFIGNTFYREHVLQRTRIYPQRTRIYPAL